MIAVVSGTTYDAACAGLPIVEEKKRGYGRRVTIEVPSVRELEDRLAEAACAMADEGQPDTVEAIYRDLEKVLG